MASALATEPPTINKAWEHFVVHVPTILLIWIASVLLAVVGFGFGLCIYVLLSLSGMALSGSTGTDTAATVGVALGQLGQLPFTILSSLVCVLFVAVPALFYERGETITVQQAFAELLRRPRRYVLAGLLFAVVSVIGYLLCILPGVAVMLVMPVYVNRIFISDQSIADAFAASFQAVYRSPRGLNTLLSRCSPGCWC
jgi:hypothetical protein